MIKHNLQYEVKGFVSVVGSHGFHVVDNNYERQIIMHNISRLRDTAQLETGTLVNCLVGPKTLNGANIATHILLSLRMSDYKACRRSSHSVKYSCSHNLDCVFSGLEHQLAAFVDKETSKFDWRAMNRFDRNLFRRFLSTSVSDLRELEDEAYENIHHYKYVDDVLRFSDAIQAEIAHRNE